MIVEQPGAAAAAGVHGEYEVERDVGIRERVRDRPGTGFGAAAEGKLETQRAGSQAVGAACLAVAAESADGAPVTNVLVFKRSAALHALGIDLGEVFEHVGGRQHQLDVTFARGDAGCLDGTGVGEICKQEGRAHSCAENGFFHNIFQMG